MTQPGHAWVGLSLLLALGSLLGLGLPSMLFDWQPVQALAEPWRWWTAAFIHWSDRHLAANLAGLLVVAALGWAAKLPWPFAVAWASAWPLTQLGWLLRPQLAHFGGLSGVLHAGVAVAVVGLLADGLAWRRGLGTVIGAGLLTKVGLEAPWGPVLRHPQGWDIAVAPWSHASGVVAGAACALVAWRWQAQRHAR